MSDIKIDISCKNIAPLVYLKEELSVGTLKIGIFADNGSGKTFLSRMFRLTNYLNPEQDYVDSLISINQKDARFAFKINDNERTICDWDISLIRGQMPSIRGNLHYIYHTFNQDYVDENLRAQGYDKESNINGYILGKTHIDISEDRQNVQRLQEQLDLCREKVEENIRTGQQKLSIVDNIKRLSEYNNLSYETIFKLSEQHKNYDVLTWSELLNDYNKVKSAPEQLDDIPLLFVNQLDIENLFSALDTILSKEYTLSSFSEDFKTLMQQNQSFIKDGVNLYNSEKTYCPFCHQPMQSEAIELIDRYVAFLQDEETKVRNSLARLKENIESVISNLKSLDARITKSARLFDIYKTNYVPSMSKAILPDWKVEAMVKLLVKLEQLCDEKTHDISKYLEIPKEIKEQLISYRDELENNIVKEINRQIETINIKKNKIYEENKEIRRNLCKAVCNEILFESKSNIESIITISRELTELKNKIEQKESIERVSKKKKVATTIKHVLDMFFGGKYKFNEDTFCIYLESTQLKKGQAARVLSEGEKSVLAFAYYLGDTHILVNKEQDYDRLFFVIDDPISSMDFNHVYTVSSLIRNLSSLFPQMTRHNRFLLLTHNSDFMRVLKTNHIIDSSLLLSNQKIEKCDENFSVPYVNHLLDVYRISVGKAHFSHTTANSIRHIIETIAHFQSFSCDHNAVKNFIDSHVEIDNKVYTLINDLSHGGWRTEQAPITEGDYILLCRAIINIVKNLYPQQIDFCKKSQ